MDRFEHWAKLATAIEGFFLHEAAAIWDVLLELQERSGITGALGEIGVWRGKSALLLALHATREERLYLADICDLRDVRTLLERFVTPGQIRVLEGRSSRLPGRLSEIPDVRGFRWFHVDGEHSGEAVVNDLRVANLLLQDEGIVCLDDFFHAMYPQVTAAAFEFLATHRHDLTLFLCGFNKGFLCRPTAAPRYLEAIRSSLVSDLARRNVRDVTVFRTTTASDMNCFGIDRRWKDYDYYGLDADPKVLPP